MIAPQTWTPFASRQEKLDCYRAWGLAAGRSVWIRRVRYGGFYVDHPVPCRVVGRVDSRTAVLEIEGALHTVSAELLADWQTGAFAQPWPEAYVVFDLETTGLSPSRDKIIEIGALLVEDGKEPQRFHTMADPELPIPPEITQLTGIRDADVADAPAPHQAVQAFLDFADGLPLVAHNARFDIGFVEASLGKQPNYVFDTLRLAQKAFPGQARYTLAALKSLLDIDVPVAHRALADVEATNQLFIACLEALNAGT